MSRAFHSTERWAGVDYAKLGRLRRDAERSAERPRALTAAIADDRTQLHEAEAHVWSNRYGRDRAEAAGIVIDLENPARSLLDALTPEQIRDGGWSVTALTHAVELRAAIAENLAALPEAQADASARLTLVRRLEEYAAHGDAA